MLSKRADDSHFPLALKETLRCLGRKPEICGMMASTDARYYFNQGGMPSIIHEGSDQREAHSRNEHAQIPDGLETAVEYAAFLINWCGRAEQGFSRVYPGRTAKVLDFQDLISVVRGPVPERPLVAIWDYAPCHASLVGGIPDMRRYYLDVEEKLSVQLRLKQRFPEALILPGVWPDLGVVIETSAFGGQITWFQNGAPYIAPSISDLKAIDHLKMPDPWNAGLMPLYLVQMRQIRHRLAAQGKTMEKLVISMGPAEIAGLVLGYDRYFLGLYDDSKRIITLMDCLTEFIIKWLHVQEEANGQAELLGLGEHVPSQVSPEQMEYFILPYIKAIFDEFPYAVKLYHNEGFHTDRHIALIQRFGFDIWHFGSDQHDLAQLYSLLDENICLFGGLNPHGVLRKGRPEEVSLETEACLRAARGRRLILSSGTGTTPDVPPENVMAMVQKGTG